MRRSVSWQAVALLLLAFAFTWPAAAATTYATIEFTEGAATIADANGVSRPARVGGTILEGESIVTGKDGELHARTGDHGLLALRPNSNVKIDAYRAKADAGDTTVVSLVRGTFRSITGWIGKYNPGGYRVRTTVATIGIRGTDHEPLFIEPGANAAGPPGTYDKVNAGGTYIENRSGRVNVDPNRAGFAPHDGTAPRVLDKIPEFFKPTRNEGRIQARKAQLEKEMEQARLERQTKEKAAAEKAKAEKSEKAEKAAEGRDKSDKESTAEKSDKTEKLDKGDAAEKSDKEEHKKAARKRHPANTK